MNEISLMKEMFNKDVFNGRNDPKLTLGHKIDEDEARGGHGHHGIVVNWGSEWKEQRRFMMR